VLLQGRYARLAWYGGANAVSVMLPLAVDRLAICPLLNRTLGPEIFGALVWVIGMGFVFGSIAGNGIYVTVQRDYAHLSEPEARAASRTLFTWAALLSLGILLACALFSLPAAPEAVRKHAAALFVPQFTAAFFRGLSLPARGLLGLKRQFGRLMLLGLIEAAVILWLFLAARTGSLWIVGAVYIASTAAPLALACWWLPEFIRGEPCRDLALRKRLLKSCGGGGLMTVLDAGQQYAPRLLLGFLANDTVAVTTLYVATSMASLFSIPVGLISALVLSVIASFSSIEQFRAHARAYLAITLGLAVGVIAASFIVGRWMIVWLYPGVAAGALAIFPWIVLAGGTMVVMLMMRPLAVKFASMRRMWSLPGITLVLQLIGLVVSVPLFGITGAAISLLVTGAASMVMWLANFAWICRQGQVAAIGPKEVSAAVVVD
jgi:O-antigen/teichoic acid export membrane protein